MEQNQAIKELTLMLLYLTSWTERGLDDVRRSWKGYDFDILDELANDDLISDSKRAKSVYLYGDAVDLAKELLEKYDIK